MHTSQTAAAGRPVAGRRQEVSAAGRTSARGFGSGDHAKQAQHGGGTVRLGGGGAGSGGAEVRLLRLGRTERWARR